MHLIIHAISLYQSNYSTAVLTNRLWGHVNLEKLWSLVSSLFFLDRLRLIGHLKHDQHMTYTKYGESSAILTPIHHFPVSIEWNQYWYLRRPSGWEVINQINNGIYPPNIPQSEIIKNNESLKSSTTVCMYYHWSVREANIFIRCWFFLFENP